MTDVVENHGGTASTTTADVTWMNFTDAGFGADFNFGTAFAGDDATMMTAGHFIRNGSETSVVTVSDIPYAIYDVYIYSQQGSGGTGRDSTFDIGTGDVWLETIASGVFDQASGTSGADPNAMGNFLYFSGLTASSFTLSIAGFGVQNQTAVMGIQIVDQTPEPASIAVWGVLAFVVAGVGWWRRKRVR